MCLSCNEGNDLLENKKCVICPKPCKSCSDANKCSSCIDNYFIFSNKCYECNVNCKTKENDDCKCSSCEDGYYLYNYQCLKCDSNCKTCSGSSTNCSNCDEHLLINVNVQVVIKDIILIIINV